MVTIVHARSTVSLIGYRSQTQTQSLGPGLRLRAWGLVSDSDPGAWFARNFLLFAEEWIYSLHNAT